MTSGSPKITNLLTRVKRIIPPLLDTFHKGQAGRVGVFGGCQHYTGAPYYSSMSSMLFGSDQSHIFCEKEAANVIKSYSPDLIVHPFLREKDKAGPEDSVDKCFELIKPMMGRLHAIVIGPGLGRDEWMQEIMAKVIEYARKNDMPMVIDADGLWLIQQRPELVSGYHNVILTPNVIEFKRLCDKLDIKSDGPDACNQLAGKLNLLIIQKGQSDIISDGATAYACSVPGGLKRCGGQGDILTGILATFLAWRHAYLSKEWDTEGNMDAKECLFLAAFGASACTRWCSRLAFKECGRATQSTDLVRHVGKAYNALMEDEIPSVEEKIKD
ncbi:ATP-dependent (S)-NAD(P)H-hydrate dehydratase [Schizosaccharomyces pombe]|uniref:ATP-dependent (S)-NAD(P)H-hydrate dehydratase n=1 Tax=Schizosaccharomyces pombe (strain 972 / ATCC 24843) TaxID=284812 RepID=NNRD_SCHPO|nr:carbohydrate kinase domain family protein [Schizosaccharomyces pombe]O94347.1 RecName: Full=ATP-dependent (S)-NAD(P)H-hydrate dehydratase; AltName: Full=ATP-dependent NAD(P)HX dehydratase [Schizosaccharomyces pombe 972h-]CAA22272.1 carbohydrate kinase domain family protein [Schizosaccharomyces pombe]|eukprot:NP_588194.1 carbohydrate kinase domain family protein [Schizosaccharomyces pombe]